MSDELIKMCMSETRAHAFSAVVTFARFRRSIFNVSVSLMVRSMAFILPMARRSAKEISSRTMISGVAGAAGAGAGAGGAAGTSSRTMISGAAGAAGAAGGGGDETTSAGSNVTYEDGNQPRCPVALLIPKLQPAITL